MKHALSVVLVALLASACARETQERPAAAPAASSTSPAPSPLALPDSAFRGDEEASRPPPSSRPAPSRFETRRIGPSEGDADGEPGSSRRFRGAPIDLDLKSADLGNVFRLLADVGRVNIVVAGDITGTVTLRLAHVPWDQALDLIARTHALELHREGNVIVVRPSEPHSAQAQANTNGAVMTIREP